MIGKPYFRKRKLIKAFVFGLDKIVCITIFKTGFLLCISRFGTVLKYREFQICLFPFEFFIYKY
jgi:hypothetical protein